MVSSVRMCIILIKFLEKYAFFYHTQKLNPFGHFHLIIQGYLLVVNKCNIVQS